MAAITAEMGPLPKVRFAVPEGVDVGVWWRQQVELYGSTPGGTVPAQSEVAFACELAFVIDCLQKPERLGVSGGAVTIDRMQVDGANIVGWTLPPSVFNGRRITNPATRFDWSPQRPARGANATLAALDRERQTMALAQLHALRTIVAAAPSNAVTTARASGWVGPALLVGSVLLVGAALQQYTRYRISVEEVRAESETRVRLAQIAQAGQDYTARLAQWRASGTMPAPSEAERAAGTVVRQAADDEWTQFWSGAAKAASGGGKLLLGVAALAAVATFSK